MARLIFVNFDPAARPFAETIAPFDAEFGFFLPENCTLADKTVLDLNCNWKFVVENLMDVYHIGTVHGRSFGAHYKGDREGYKFKLLPRGGYSFFFEAAPVTTDGKSHFGKMPWLDRPDTLACLGFLAPNLNFSGRCDAIRHWLTWPISPEEASSSPIRSLPRTCRSVPTSRTGCATMSTPSTSRSMRIAPWSNRCRTESAPANLCPAR